jgi:hypothetical protein
MFCSKKGKDLPISLIPQVPLTIFRHQSGPQDCRVRLRKPDTAGMTPVQAPTAFADSCGCSVSL